LTLENHSVTLGKGFAVLPQAEGEFCQIRTPSWYPVSVIPLARQAGVSWEATALDFLLSHLPQADPKVSDSDTPEEVQIKREGPWTTIYWTYGGTRAYFGMYWGGRSGSDQPLLFWASPTKAPGRAQYQALSEITKGVKVDPS